MRTRQAIWGAALAALLLFPAPILSSEGDPNTSPDQPSGSPPTSLIQLLQAEELGSLASVLDPKHPLSGGVSQGDPWTGRIANALGLPVDGKFIAILPDHRRRQRHYASKAMETLLLDVSEALVQKYAAPRMMLGDISAKEGGPISHHASHRSGRDVDIAFYCSDKAGKGQEARGLDKVSKDGESAHKLHFDVAQNWAMVAEMLTHPTTQIQFIFVADSLRSKMLAHAKKTQVSQALYTRAWRTLSQPSKRAPHDDHFHVRIYCSSADRTEGCIERGPYWGDVDTQGQAASLRVHLLLQGASSGPLDQRLASIDALVRLNMRSSTGGLAALLLDPSPQIRAAVVHALQQLSLSEEAAQTLLLSIPRSPPQQRATLLHLLASAPSSRLIGPLLRQAQLASSDPTRSDAGDLVFATLRLKDRRAIPLWIDLLSSPNISAQGAALWSLQTLANRIGPTRTLRPGENEQTLEVTSFWRSWWETHRDEDSDQWILDGFNRHGISIKGFKDHAAIPDLIAAQTTAPGPLSRTAHHVLVRMTRERNIPENTPPPARQRRWEQWWKKNKKRFH